MSGKTFKIVQDDISDGHHTFDELYEHRYLLFLNLCLKDMANAFWKPDFEGWFCLYWESSKGQLSYHLPNKFLRFVEGRVTKDLGHVWDGHTSKDVVSRLMELSQ